MEQTFQSLQQAEGQLPSVDDLVQTLRLCRAQRILVHASNIHMNICNHGLDTHSSIGNHLVPLFLECGSLQQAQQSFSRLAFKSPSSFTSLMHGFIDYGHCQLAVDLFNIMQEEHLYITDFAFVAILRACSKMRSLERGRIMHYEIVKEEYENNPFIGNTLIDMYAHCKSPAEAWDVLDTLETRDVSAWNAMISGFIESDCCEEALGCFEQMQLQGVLPNAVTFKCTLKACGILGATMKLQALHSKVNGAGFGKDISIGNTLIDVYGKCGLLTKAQEVFDILPVQDVVSWNGLISGYMEHSLYGKALICLEEMQKERVTPNTVTYLFSLKACASIKAIQRGQEIHLKFIKQALEESLFVHNSLVDFYAQCGLFSEAQDVFNNLPVKDVVTWTALIAGYVSHGYNKEALRCLKEMQFSGVSPNVISWTAIIMGVAEDGESEKAFELHQQMQEQGISPNIVTLVSIFKACGEAAALMSGRSVHARVQHFVQPYESTLAVPLIDMYGKCGSMFEAEQVFETLTTRGLLEWNVIIAGYARLGASELVFKCFEQMRIEGILPDGVSFVSILGVCSHVGLLVKGQECFRVMSDVYHIAETIKHYSCLVDLFSRAGQLDEALGVTKYIYSEPDPVIWSSVLVASRKSGNLNLNRQALYHLFDFNDYSAALISMLSIYTDGDMGEE